MDQMNPREPNWEYQTLEVNTAETGLLHFQVSALGSLGWEICGFASVDKTIGFNAMFVLLKRPAKALPPPADVSAGWRDDPSGRFKQRHWDGCRWSEHVIDDTGPTTDWPTVERLVPPRTR